MGKVQTRLDRELTLYVRQLAWLNAKPRPAAGSKRAEQFDTSKAVSRADQMKAAKVTPQLPPLSAPHFFHWLIEIGLTETAGMGAGPLPWREISAWVERTGVDLAPWEARLIRALSAAYVTESRRAEDETAVAPYHTGEVSQAEVRHEIDSLRNVLG